MMFPFNAEFPFARTIRPEVRRPPLPSEEKSASAVGICLHLSPNTPYNIQMDGSWM